MHGAPQNFLTFAGVKYKHLPQELCKADDVRELKPAIAQIGWVHEATLETDFHTMHNLNARSGPLKSPPGLLLLCLAKYCKKDSCFEVAFRDPFEGPRLLLGRFMHYRIHDPARRSKFGASAAPGLFAGWRFEHAFVC